VRGVPGGSPPGAGRDYFFFPAFFLPATVFFLPLRVRALVWVRCPCTGSPRRWDPLVAADLDLPPDIGLNLAAEVSFDLVGRVDPVAELHQLVVGEAADPGVPVDPCGLQRLQRSGTADAVDIGECDLDPLIAGQVHTGKPGHVRAVLLLLAEVLHTAPHALPGHGPGLRPGVAALASCLRCASFVVRQPCRCLCLGSAQMTMTRPCRRMIRHLLQIFLTLGLTFTVLSLRNLILLLVCSGC